MTHDKVITQAKDVSIGNRLFSLGQVIIAALSVALVSGYNMSNSSANELEAGSVRAMTIWQVIDSLVAHAPLTKQSVESTLSMKLREAQSGSRTFRFFMGDGVKLQGGLDISKIDLRSSSVADRQGFMVVSVAGRCMSLQEVRQEYAYLTIVEAPRGRSPNEATWYSSSEPWGSLSFGFKERSPTCLSEIVITPTK